MYSVSHTWYTQLFCCSPDTGRIMKVVFGQLDGETSPVIAEELTV